MSDYKDPIPVQGSEITSMDLIGSSEVKIYVGPESISIDGATDVSKFIFIGLIQEFGIQSSRSVRMLSQLSTNDKLVVTSRGQKGLMLSSILTLEKNAISALYSYYFKERQIEGYHIFDVNDPILKNDIGLLLEISFDTDEETIFKYFNNVKIVNWGSAFNQGDKGVAEQVSLTWGKTSNLDENGGE